MCKFALFRLNIWDYVHCRNCIYFDDYICCKGFDTHVSVLRKTCFCV